jgi:uncharacterized membrane protein
LTPPKTDGNETPEPSPQAPPRIERLSDMVFGLALSLGAFALVASPPSNATALYTDLATFGFSFLILIVVWLTYTRLITALTLEHHSAVRLNVVLLFFVSIEPFLLNVLVRPGLSGDFFAAVSQAYAIDVGAMVTLLGLFAWALGTTQDPSTPDGARRSFRREALRRWFGAGMFFVSAAPFFEAPDLLREPVRLWLWGLALGIVWAAHVGRMSPRPGNEPDSGHSAST